MAIFGEGDVCVEPVLDLSEASSPAVPIATLD
jgi:hypothetical protein